MSLPEKLREVLILSRYEFKTYEEIARTLDCSVGEARVKARATAIDSDRDGHLDYSKHEISVFDGVSKLQVLSFMTPWRESVTADMGYWIEAINAVSDVLQPARLASAD